MTGRNIERRDKIKRAEKGKEGEKRRTGKKMFFKKYMKKRYACVWGFFFTLFKRHTSRTATLT